MNEEMSRDEGKKYTLSLEAESLTYKDLLLAVLDVVNDMVASEDVIKSAGWTMCGAGDKLIKSRYSINVMPWEI
jgi:GH35 family endo-1,4-beta-xylanase